MKSLPTMVTSRLEQPVALAVSLLLAGAGGEQDGGRQQEQAEEIAGRLLAAARRLASFDARMGRLS